MAGDTQKTRLLTLVFTDLAGSTALKTKLGDDAAGELISRHHAHVRRILADHGGREIDAAGDGFFLTFETASSATVFALQLQEAHAEDPVMPGVRIGIHLGEVNERAGAPGSSKPVDVEGLAVDLAARIQSLALPRQVLMSSSVFDSARQRLKSRKFKRPIEWCAHGPYLLKGIDDPVSIGEAGIQGFSPLKPPSDSEKARKAVDASLKDRYELLRVLGKGGFAVVYLAHDKILDQEVAIKVLKLDPTTEGDRKRFIFEARTGAKLRHKAIATVFDIVQGKDSLQLVMEYYPGGSLADLIKKRGALPAKEALDYARQIATGLAFAHTRKIIHRDIKPHNVFIAGDKSIKIGDFGIAAQYEEHEYTTTGEVMGTPLYMAPEQTKDATDVDPRSDLFALGMTMYHMLTGQPPRIVDLELIHTELRPLIRAMTSLDRNDRPVSAEQLIAMIDQAETALQPTHIDLNVARIGAPSPPSPPGAAADPLEETVAEADAPRTRERREPGETGARTGVGRKTLTGAVAGIAILGLAAGTILLRVKDAGEAQSASVVDPPADIASAAETGAPANPPERQEPPPSTSREAEEPARQEGPAQSTEVSAESAPGDSGETQGGVELGSQLPPEPDAVAASGPVSLPSATAGEIAQSAPAPREDPEQRAASAQSAQPDQPPAEPANTSSLLQRLGSGRNASASEDMGRQAISAFQIWWDGARDRINRNVAIENLRKATNLSPEDPLFPYLLGRIYEETGDLLNSRTAYMNVLRLDSTLEKLLGNPEFEKLRSKGIKESAERLRSLVADPDPSRAR